MKTSREDLERILSNLCMNIALDNELCTKIYDYAKEKHDIPRGIISDLVCLRMSMSEVSEFILFCLYESIIENTDTKNNLNYYYTDQEINQYLKSKYQVDKIKFPLRFKMIQVKEDQWVGSVTAKTLMKLRAAQLINYNTNAQRTMKKIVRGDKEIYRISLNQNAVNEIKNSYEKNEFIPNTITLNIPMYSDNDYYYDSDSNELVINRLEYFDELDGFHRYIALCKASDNDQDFDYDMELRIVNWDDSRGQTFIYQEDKRTPIRKIDAESMNMNKTSNIIVERLNNSVHCNMKGLISRNDGIINFAEMSALVDWFYVKGKEKKNKNAMQLQAVRELTENINILTEGDVKYLENRWNYKMLLSVMCVFDYCNKNPEQKRDICWLVDKVYVEISQSNDRKFNNKTPRKALIDMIMRVIES